MEGCGLGQTCWVNALGWNLSVSRLMYIVILDKLSSQYCSRPTLFRAVCADVFCRNTLTRWSTQPAVRRLRHRCLLLVILAFYQ